MANSTSIVPGLTYEDLIVDIDATVNANLLWFFLHGVYTVHLSGLGIQLNYDYARHIHRNSCNYTVEYL